MHLPVTLLYAGLLGLWMSVLSIRVPLRRGALDIPFGDGGDLSLASRIRAFGNFIEYVPMFLVLLGLLEGAGTSTVWLHGLGIGMLASRVLHGLVYVAAPKLTVPQQVGRGIAAMSTWLLLLGAAGLATVTVWR